MKKIATAFIITAMFGAGIYLGTIKRSDDQLKRLMQDSVITILSKPKALEAFTLEDHNGNIFTKSSLQGKWSLLFFGYTNCPDICPTTLTTLNQMHTQLAGNPELQKGVQIVFVSVDPGRDNTQTLKNYVTHFNRDFIGVSGAKNEIATLAKQVGVHYEVLQKSGKNNYGVNHSAAIIVTNREAGFFGIMSPPFDAAAMAVRMELLNKL